MKRIACIGSVTTDILVKPADAIPAPGVLQYVDNVQMLVGGCASNAAMDMAIMGIPSELLCLVGEDNFGNFVKMSASQKGVGIAGVRTRAGVPTTGSVVCIGSTGERSFLYSPGSTSEFTLEDVDDAVLDTCDIVFVAGAMLLTKFDGEPCAKLMKRMQEAGKFTVMDTAWDSEGVWLPKIEAVLPYLDLFMPSYDEAVKLTGEEDPNRIADFFFDKGVKTVIIKLGSKGALICESRTERYELSTYRSVKPVDTTGAGDSFCAGFLSGLSMGWNYRKSGQFANAVGTHCIMAIGANGAISKVDDILAFMEAHQDEVAL
ncbi:MAG: carbohydrate kinase family protein [Clostridia bacterium]|nr:carbohydrate kinase family protein [Clostridia bacterium]